MKKNEIIERIAWVPAWGKSLLAAILVFVINGIISSSIGQPLSYIIWSLMMASASFLICILHPKHVWIVPLLCNIFVIPVAIMDPKFWTTTFGLILGLGVILSFIMAHFGALLGRRRESRNTI